MKSFKIISNVFVPFLKIVLFYQNGGGGNTEEMRQHFERINAIPLQEAVADIKAWKRGCTSANIALCVGTIPFEKFLKGTYPKLGGYGSSESHL